MRDFSTVELVEERKGKEKIFDEIRKKRVDEKKRQKKRNQKKTKKEGRWFGEIFFFFLITIILVHNKLKIKYTSIAMV